MADVHKSENNKSVRKSVLVVVVEVEESPILDYMVDICDNDSESNECDKNGGGYLSSVSDCTAKFALFTMFALQFE